MPKFRLSCALAALSLLSAAPVAAEVTGGGPDSFVSRHEVVVKASPKEVWLALISPATWWTSEHTWSGEAANLTLTPQAGGCFCEKIPEVDEPGRFTLEGSVEHMRVIQAYPERALRMQGALGPLQSEPVNGILTIAISEVEQGTRIVWEYNVGGPMRYELPVIARAVDGVMGLQIKSLAKGLGPVEMPKPEPEPEPEPAPEGEPAADEAAPAPAPAKAPAAPAKAPAAATAPGAKAPVVPVAPAKAAAKPAEQVPEKAPPPKAKIPTVDDVFSDLADEDKP
ncbi:MAG: SRPBCC family protein [Porphyrobacter sp.]|nr:SRPBCC family protein [Porphyrobacter sp.]